MRELFYYTMLVISLAFVLFYVGIGIRNAWKWYQFNRAATKPDDLPYKKITADSNDPPCY